MKIWNLAILEDNKELLNDRIKNLQLIENANVTIAATNSEDFLSKVNTNIPDAILIDIDLNGDSMSGLDIAYKLKLPVLFVSGENAQHIKDLENLKREHELIVDHLTKPFSDSNFIKTVQLFLKDIYIRHSAEFKLPKGHTKQGVPYDSIVFLSADKMEGSESNNKMIYFKDRLPQKLIDFSFSNMESHGFDSSHFLKIHRSFRVNKKHIKKYDFSQFSVIVDAFSSSGKLEEKHLRVSENYRNEIRKHFQSL